MAARGISLCTGAEVSRTCNFLASLDKKSLQWIDAVHGVTSQANP